MKKILLIASVVLLVSGCSNTWRGAKEDTQKATKWTKEKINDAATFIKEKTE